MATEKPWKSMAQKQGLQRTARDCKGLQVCKTFFFFARIWYWRVCATSSHHKWAGGRNWDLNRIASPVWWLECWVCTLYSHSFSARPLDGAKGEPMERFHGFIRLPNAWVKTQACCGFALGKVEQVWQQCKHLEVARNLWNLTLVISWTTSVRRTEVQVVLAWRQDASVLSVLGWLVASLWSGDLDFERLHPYLGTVRHAENADLWQQSQAFTRKVWTQLSSSHLSQWSRLQHGSTRSLVNARYIVIQFSSQSSPIVVVLRSLA